MTALHCFAGWTRAGDGLTCTESSSVQVFLVESGNAYRWLLVVRGAPILERMDGCLMAAMEDAKEAAARAAAWCRAENAALMYSEIEQTWSAMDVP